MDSFLPIVGVMFDLDLWPNPMGLLDLFSMERLPMEVADLSLWTSGFSGTGLGIFETQGVSGEGGASSGEGDDGKGGPSMMPLATL